MAHEHLERVNRDRLALADELVKARRAESPPESEEEIARCLRECFRPRLADTGSVRSLA